MDAFWVVLKIIFFWCIFWWIVGPIYFYTRVRHYDLWLIHVPFAPLLLPALIACWLEDKKFQLREYLFTRTARKIADKLQEGGILVTSCGYNALHDSCEVVATITSEQVKSYQSVYTWALKIFRNYTAKQLCEGANQKACLNREWASNSGINEYFAEHFIPCMNCANRRPMGWFWGNDDLHVKPHNVAFNYSLERVYTCADGTQKIFSGWLCKDCEKILVGPWKSMTGW